jgi:hypothetical protein
MFEVKQGIRGTLFRACVTVSACKRICALQGKRVIYTKGDDCCGRLSLLTFFGEAKKVSGCRAAPGNALLHGERTASTYANHQPIKKGGHN